MLGDITAAGELYIVTGYTDILRKYLMADETRIQVLKEPERNPETGSVMWLFRATPKGATASALVYTMVEMAKTNELNIYKYLTYLLEHRPSEDMLDEQLEALTPWSKEVQNVCKN